MEGFKNNNCNSRAMKRHVDIFETQVIRFKKRKLLCVSHMVLINSLELLEGIIYKGNV